jgi:hypothetical protein
MTPDLWRALLIVAVLTHAAENEAFACSCNGTGGPPCQAAWTADVVFAGTVRAVQQIDHETLGAPYHSVLVQFEVERGFVNAVAGPLEIVTGTGGGDCGYRFTTGARYLVYASKTASSRLYAGICSRTRPLDKAGEDIRYLTSIPATGTGGRVYGRVHELRRDPAEATAVDYGPVENVTVTVRGATFAREAVTDAQGRYQVPNLPTGEVTVSVVPPAGFDMHYLERELELRDLRACSEMDFTISQTGSAWGMVVDASGRPVAGVGVEAVAAELAGFDPPPFQHPARTDDRGVFEFEDLPPGRYVFGVNLTKRPGARQGGEPLFLPGTAVAREATVIEVKQGDREDIGVLRLTDR